MKIHLLFLTALIFFVSCDNDQGNDDPCIGNQICTTELKSITVSVLDQEGNPVALENYYTFIDSRTRIEPDSSLQQIDKGIYPVATDNDIDKIDFEGTTVV
ncbi:hypothetical protein C9994_11160, partial [Marivirga lumbricoides]